MSDTTHTEGPWEFTENGHEGRYFFWVYADEYCLWHQQTMAEDDVAEFAANGRLIAAAPDLKSALERLLRRFDALLAQKPVRDVEETRAEVRAALAKANGES